MEIALTAKVRIIFQNHDDIISMKKTMDLYRQACNIVSQFIFNFIPESNNGMSLPNIPTINEALYHTIRSDFNLKSQMTQSTFRTVLGKYKTTQRQLSNQNVCDNITTTQTGKEKRHYIKKDLRYLWTPIQFKRPQVDLVYNRDYGFRPDGQLALNTVDGRISVQPILKGVEHFFDGSWKFGTGKVVQSGNHWFFHIAVTKEFPDFEPKSLEDVSTVVGIDRGLVQLLTIFDGEKTIFVNGTDVSRKRKHWSNLRQSLQKKNTRSSKRRLKSLGKRESRWMSDVNHCLSKTLVATYGAHALFVLEDLTGVTFDTVTKRRKENRYEHHSWAFYDFETKLRYKAEKAQSKVLKVPAQYTSQRCVMCGNIDKNNRHRDRHEYHCVSCGYRTNDDRIASMNIRELGIRYLNGDSKPKYIK